MINDLFRDMINKEDIAIFIDNVLVATEIEEGHNEIVEEVLRRLEENDFYIKPEKCVWKVREIDFLGVIIGPEGFRMEKKKVEGVMNWPISQCIKDIQKFLGLVNYYRQFVKDFAKIAKPLYQLVRKDKKWKWKGKQEEAFIKLKRIFMTEPVLAALDLDKEMRVRGRCIRLCNGRSIVSERRGRKMETSGLHLQIAE